MREILVAPSILSADFSRLSEEIDLVLKAGADWLHVDVMDGHFVPNITMGPPVVKSLRKATDAILDVHLMIENPDDYIEAFAKAGSNYITVHIETLKDPKATFQKIRDLGAKPGITLRPSTCDDEIMPFLLDVDLILVMTVEPGFSGQSFMPGPLKTISRVREKITQLGHKAYIEVDGGVNDKTCSQVKEAGADVLVSGSYVFGNNYAESIKTLKEG